MPTYEYKCKSCGKMSEFFQSMTAKPMKQCPHCSKNTLERQIGIGAAVVFKGSGFYQTDYRSESYKKAAEAESKSSSAAPAAADTKAASTSAESKPANANAQGSSAPSAGPESKAGASTAASTSGREDKPARSLSSVRVSKGAQPTAASRTKPAGKSAAKPARKSKR